jgi:hypothetical protein
MRASTVDSLRYLKDSRTKATRLSLVLILIPERLKAWLNNWSTPLDAKHALFIQPLRVGQEAVPSKKPMRTTAITCGVPS